MPRSFHDAAARADVLKRMSALEPGTRPGWGKMNAGQMLCHLSGALRMALGELKTVSKGKVAFQRFPVKHLAMYVVPWPKGLPTAPELVSTAPVVFDVEAASFRAMVQRFGETKPPDEPAEHPMFGKLSWAQWGHLMYRHADHHLRQFGV
jgi:hypothetical protein